jgi:hypothetical protein
MEVEYTVEADDGYYECRAKVTAEEGDEDVGEGWVSMTISLTEYRYYTLDDVLVYDWVYAWIAPTELKPDHWLELEGQDYLPSLEEYADWERNQAY